MNVNNRSDRMQALFIRFPAAREELDYQVARHDLEYADNYRVARVNYAGEMEAYYEAQRYGCCGTFEWSLTIDGQKFLIGCNYGH